MPLPQWPTHASIVTLVDAGCPAHPATNEPTIIAISAPCATCCRVAALCIRVPLCVRRLIPSAGSLPNIAHRSSELLSLFATSVAVGADGARAINGEKGDRAAILT